MVLFQIESEVAQDFILTYMRHIHNEPILYIRIDGLRDEGVDNQWYYYAYGKTPAYPDLRWASSANTPAGNNSLIIYSESPLNPTFIDGARSSDLLNAMCQY